MKNKVLISLYVSEIGNKYDIFIPVNEYIWKVQKLILKSISDLNGGIVDINKNYVLINLDNGRVYTPNEIIIKTDIRNATRLIITENKS